MPTLTAENAETGTPEALKISNGRLKTDAVVSVDTLNIDLTGVAQEETLQLAEAALESIEGKLPVLATSAPASNAQAIPVRGVGAALEVTQASIAELVAQLVAYNADIRRRLPEPDGLGHQPVVQSISRQNGAHNYGPSTGFSRSAAATWNAGEMVLPLTANAPDSVAMVGNVPVTYTGNGASAIAAFQIVRWEDGANLNQATLDTSALNGAYFEWGLGNSSASGGMLSDPDDGVAVGFSLTDGVLAILLRVRLRSGALFTVPIPREAWIDPFDGSVDPAHDLDTAYFNKDLQTQVRIGQDRLTWYLGNAQTPIFEAPFGLPGPLSIPADTSVPWFRTYFYGVKTASNGRTPQMRANISGIRQLGGDVNADDTRRSVPRRTVTLGAGNGVTAPLCLLRPRLTVNGLPNGAVLRLRRAVIRAGANDTRLFAYVLPMSLITVTFTPVLPPVESGIREPASEYDITATSVTVNASFVNNPIVPSVAPATDPVVLDLSGQELMVRGNNEQLCLVIIAENTAGGTDAVELLGLEYTENR